jgi:hypothetical protein
VPSRRALGPTQPPTQKVPEVKRPGRAADHSPTSSSEVKNAQGQLYFYLTVSEILSVLLQAQLCIKRHNQPACYATDYAVIIKTIIIIIIIIIIKSLKGLGTN